jgi:hypothetical protein
VNDNENITLLPENLFQELHTCALQTNALVYDLPITEFLPQIQRASRNVDPSVRKATHRQHGCRLCKARRWHAFVKNRIYVPVDKKLWEDIIRTHHDSPLAGHPGCFKTSELILREYWWPTLKKDVQHYVDGCETCQCTKPHRIKKNPLHPFEPPSLPWEVITVDIIGPLPESQGYNAILVIVDWFSKAVKFEAITMELDSLGFAWIMRDWIF